MNFVSGIPRLANGCTGISGVELLVTVALFLIISILTYSKLPDVLLTYERNQTVQQLRADLKRVRSEALSEGTRTVISFADDMKSYSIGFDHLPYNSPVGADDIQYSREVPDSMQLYTSDPIIFDSRGFLIDENGEYNSLDIQAYQNGSYIGYASVYTTGVVILGD